MISVFVSRYTVGVIVIAGIVVLPTLYFFKKYIYSDEKVINKVLFFCDEGVDCRNHIGRAYQKKPCSLRNCSRFNYNQILQYVNGAERHLDVCIYLFTVEDLGATIIQAYMRGAKVRVITDEDTANNTDSQTLRFRENGITVRHQQKSDTLMHHKFVIIDKRIVMTGSLNWTRKGFCGNWENVVITSEPSIVSSFILEYDRLWQNLK